MKFSIFGWSVVAGFGVLLFTLIPHSTSAQTNRCFFYDPSWYSTQTSSSVITPSQTINIPYSTTASIFQKIPLNNGCYNPGGSTTISYTPSAIILGTEVLTLAGNDWNVETNNIRIDTIQPYAKTAAGTIRLNEDKIINYIDANKNANGVAQIQFRGYGGGNITGQPNIDTDLIPFTNCVKIGGSAIGRKIVFMRGNGWVSTATDLLAQSQAIKNQILATDPFKTYSDQLSFYVDLKKQNQPAALAGTAATVKSQSSCGTGAFEYIYLYTGTRGTFSFPGQGVSFLEYGNFTAANGPLIAVREIGKAVANLTDEQRNPTVTGNLPHETNCTTDPFVGFRDSATNHIYGSPTLTRCSFEKNTSGKIYYRANNESLMGGAFSVTQPTLPANKFNVVSCGYIVAAIKGDPLIKASALKYWPVCKTMKTANDGIPDVPPTPNIYNYDGHPVPGELTSIHVENSTPTGNSIQIKSDGDDSIYEITNLPSNNVGGIEFTFPQEITLRSSGEQYTLKTGSLNSDWSTEVEVKPRTSGPKNLTAKEKNRGEITLSWTVAKPAADIAIYTVQKKIKEGAGFTDVRDISRDSGEENTVVLKGYPPSASATFRVVAKYYGWSSYNNNSDYVSEPSNEVTITTMPQLKAPVLYALSGSENAIQLFWTTEDSEDVKQFILMEQKGTLSGSISTSNTQSFVHKNLTPGSEHCYSVYASINANNDSLESNVACATAGSSDVDGITMNQPGSTFTGTGSLSLSVPSNGSATPSSVNFYIDGQEVGTDTSQPWNSSFDSTNFTNGDHVGFAQINRPSQPPANTPGVPVKINNPLNVTKIENDVTPNNFIAYGSGFSATGNKIILTLSSNSLTSSKGSLFHDDIFSEFASVMNSDYGKLFAKILPTFSVTSQSQLAQAANSYEIPSLTSDGKRIRFAVPQSVPKGTYVVSIATPTSGPTATTFKINVADLTTTTITIPPGSSSSFLLTVQKTNDNNARGKVSGNSIDCGSACSVTLPAGTQVNLTATPTSNLSTFVGWNYDACGGQNPCSFILSGPTTVTADFEIGTREPLRTDIPVITEMVGQPNHSVPQGSVITVNGSGFSYPTFNKVIIVNDAKESEMYTISGRTSFDRKSFSFKLPSNILPGSYHFAIKGVDVYQYPSGKLSYTPLTAVDDPQSNDMSLIVISDPISGGVTPPKFNAKAKGAGTNILTWQDISDESGFEIKRSDGVTFTLPANTTSYVDTAVKSDVAYGYTLNSTYLSSGYAHASPPTKSDKVVNKILPKLKIDALSPYSINLTWTDGNDSNADGSVLAPLSYTIRRQDSHTDLEKEYTKRSYSVDNLEPKTKYCFTVAIHSSGTILAESLPSCIVTPSPLINLTLTTPTPTQGIAHFKLSDEAPKNSTADMYIVGGSSPDRKVTTIMNAPGEFSFNTLSLKNGTYKFYALVHIGNAAIETNAVSVRVSNAGVPVTGPDTFSISSVGPSSEHRIFDSALSFGLGTRLETTPEWKWVIVLTLASPKTIKSIDIVRSDVTERWSTADKTACVLHRAACVLVVFENDRKLNSKFGQTLGMYYTAPVTLNLYGQSESSDSLSPSFDIKVTLTDGTVLSQTYHGGSAAVAPAPVLPQPVPPAQSTQIQTAPSATESPLPQSTVSTMSPTPTPTPTSTLTPTPTSVTPTSAQTTSTLKEIHVTSLTSPAIWQRGSSQTITWDVQGSSYVNIRLLRNGTFDRMIADNIKVNGEHMSYTWTIPQNLISGKEYSIKVMNEVATYSGTSMGTFSVE